MGYDDIVVRVHGGLTFAENVTPKLLEKWKDFGLDDSDLGSWIVGFDTCHCADNSSIWPKDAVEKETLALLEQIENYKVP